ncbi:MAG: hypothetical protein HGA49_02685 [Eubacteriaceae bacterium]|nr:hypothetical protein [Eubacteriaceae bacterium]
MYQVTVSSGSQYIPIAIFGVIALTFGVKLFTYLKKAEKNRKDLFDIIILVFVAVLIGSMFGGMRYYNKISIEGGRVEATFITGLKKIDLSAEEITKSYVIDWKVNDAYTPTVRKFGTSMGSYKEGRFKLKNGMDALLLCSGTKALVLETEETMVLLSPNDFDGFLADFETNVEKTEKLEEAK